MRKRQCGGRGRHRAGESSTLPRAPWKVSWTEPLSSIVKIQPRPEGVGTKCGMYLSSLPLMRQVEEPNKLGSSCAWKYKDCSSAPLPLVRDLLICEEKIYRKLSLKQEANPETYVDEMNGTRNKDFVLFEDELVPASLVKSGRMREVVVPQDYSSKVIIKVLSGFALRTYYNVYLGSKF